MKTFPTATLTLLLAGATGAAAAADPAALDGQIRTTLADIRGVAANIAALRAALAGAATTDPGSGRAAGDSTAPTPGTSPSSSSGSSFMLAAEVAVAEAQLVQLQLQLDVLLRERAAEESQERDDSESPPGTAAKDGSMFGMTVTYQKMTQREAAEGRKLHRTGEAPADAKLEPGAVETEPAKPRPLARRTR